MTAKKEFSFNKFNQNTGDVIICYCFGIEIRTRTTLDLVIQFRSIAVSEKMTLLI